MEPIINTFIASNEKEHIYFPRLPYDPFVWEAHILRCNYPDKRVLIETLIYTAKIARSVEGNFKLHNWEWIIEFLKTKLLLFER